MDLYVGPRHKRSGRGWLLVLLIVLVAGVIAWQRGWLTQDALDRLAHSIEPYAPVFVSPLFDGTESQQTAVADAQPTVNAPVMQIPALESSSAITSATEPTGTLTPTLQSEAYTAALYNEPENEGEIPWPNVGGRTKVETYAVEEGDTLWSIATQFELDIDTLRWSNPALERNPDVLSLGTELTILPVPGVYHVVVEDDTVETIAASYGVVEADITDYPPNVLYPPFELKPGRGIIVPFGRKELNVPQPSPALDSPLAWPVSGPITQQYHADHLAIDIGGPYGTTVYAADDGEVIYARWAETGYGYTLIIDHGEGMETWYSHLKGTLLQSGFVERGTPIGEMGSTGRSTGPHVHFEVRVNGEQVNPLDYLPDSPN